MPLRLQRKIEKLKIDVRELGRLVSQRVDAAIQSILDRDVGLASAVMNGDDEIDVFEVELEESCLATIALDQPVAADMRFIVAVMKINNDLERIGDLAVSIAQNSRALVELDAGRDVPFDLEGEARVVLAMLELALESLVTLDVGLAHEVLQQDDAVDRIHAEMYERVREAIERDPRRTAEHLRYLSTSRCLERIADHLTNIAEDVIYTVDGEIHRHGLHRPD